MQDTPLLPPALAGAADIAAGHGLNVVAPGAAGAEGASFDSVLEAHLKESFKADPLRAEDMILAAEISPMRAGESLAGFLADRPPGMVLPAGLVQRFGSGDVAAGGLVQHSGPVDVLNQSEAGVSSIALLRDPVGVWPALEQLQAGEGRPGDGLFPAVVVPEGQLDEVMERPGAFSAVLEATVRAEALQSAQPAAGTGGAEEPTAQPRLPIHASIGSQAWDGQFTDRVIWITQARQSSAELILNPPQLGPVEVHVTVSVEQVATLSFHAGQPAVREAIQANLVRLQEAFANNGLQLADVFVGSGTAGSRDERRGARAGGADKVPWRGGVDVSPSAGFSGAGLVHPRIGVGRVDLFA